MRFWKSMAGLYYIEILSAAPPQTLTAINNMGITLFDIVYADDLRVKGYIYRKDFKALTDLLMHRGEELKVIRKSGIHWSIWNLWKRPVLIIGMFLFLFMVLYLPTRILFVEIEGNCVVPSKMIEEKAQECGISFGASRRTVRSEKTKNALLSAIPELQWAGVNTRGCVAVISVQERSEINDNSSSTGVSSIAAARDGIIQEIIVERGNLLCRIGQAVIKDQILVSGYTDCGISIKAERAEAEIMAYTVRQMNVVTPVGSYCRGKDIKKIKRYSLYFGKNIINFWKDSGISDAICVKIKKEYCLTLPGGFQLPFSIVEETLTYYDRVEMSFGDVGQFDWVELVSRQYLLEQMVSGEIRNSVVRTQITNGVFQLLGQYSCLEMIGQVRNEEIVRGNGKTNR